MGMWGNTKATFSKGWDAYKKYTPTGRALSWLGGGPQGQWDPERGNFDLPGYEQMRGQYGQLLGQGPRGAPQAGTSDFRSDQAALVGALQAQARGEGPGQEIARRQAEQQVDRGLGQQLATARSARPGQSAMAARNAAMAAGQLQGAGAQAASMGGLMAQQQATGQLGGVLAGARGQDLQRNLANAQLQYQTMGLDDARQLELLRQQLALGQAQQHGGIAYETALGQKYATQMAQPSNLDRALGAAQGIGQAYMTMQGGGMGAGGAGVAARQAPPPSYVPQLQTGTPITGYNHPYAGMGGTDTGFNLGLSPGYGKVNPAGSGITGAQTGYTLPRL